jgi:hypothetical protein
MSLSIEKLINMCENSGLIPVKFFTYKGDLVFLQTLSLKKGYSFIINIPRKYHFDISKNNFNNVYKLKKLKIKPEEILHKHFSPNQLDSNEIYSEIQLIKDFNPDIEDKDLEEKLLETYRKQIFLSNIKKDEFATIKEIFKQIDRLKYCVQGIDYKVCIIYKNYLVNLSGNGEIDFFLIKDYDKGLYRKLLVSLDFNLLFDNIDRIEEHLTQVVNGFDSILLRSQQSHYNKFLLFMDTTKTIKQKIDEIYSTREKVRGLIKKYEYIIENCNYKQSYFYEKLKILQPSDNMSSDLNYFKQKNELETNINKLDNIKSIASEKLVALRDKDSDNILQVDNILFDNIVMFNSILNNLKKLDIIK